jgi:hypothetical protein
MISLKVMDSKALKFTKDMVSCKQNLHASSSRLEAKQSERLKKFIKRGGLYFQQGKNECISYPKSLHNVFT